jgi:hypothetical protein
VSASAPGTLSLLTRERSTGSPASASPGTFPARCRAAEFGKRTRDPSGTSDAPELFSPRHSSRALDNETETKPDSTVGRNFFRAQHFPISICDLWADPRAAPAGLGQSVTPSAAASREVRKGRERPLLTRHTRCNGCIAPATHVYVRCSHRRREILGKQSKEKGLAHWPDLGRLSERTLGGSSPPATCAAQATK